MITSSLSQLPWYKMVSPNFAKAIEFATNAGLANLTPGRYEIDGENVFAMVNEYTTKSPSDCQWESHRKYADIQIMIAGAEKFGYIPQTSQEPTTPYQPDQDVMLYSAGEEAFGYTTLHPGQFIIFFPSDIHQPEVFSNHPALVKKLVIKVKI